MHCSEPDPGGSDNKSFGGVSAAGGSGGGGSGGGGGGGRGGGKGPGAGAGVGEPMNVELMLPGLFAFAKPERSSPSGDSSGSPGPDSPSGSLTQSPPLTATAAPSMSSCSQPLLPLQQLSHSLPTAVAQLPAEGGGGGGAGATIGFMAHARSHSSDPHPQPHRRRQNENEKDGDAASQASKGRPQSQSPSLPSHQHHHHHHHHRSASGGGDAGHAPAPVSANLFNRRSQLLTILHRTRRSVCARAAINAHRERMARAGCEPRPMVALDLLRKCLQPYINRDIRHLLDRYVAVGAGAAFSLVPLCARGHMYRVFSSRDTVEYSTVLVPYIDFQHSSRPRSDQLSFWFPQCIRSTVHCTVHCCPLDPISDCFCE